MADDAMDIKNYDKYIFSKEEIEWLSSFKRGIYLRRLKDEDIGHSTKLEKLDLAVEEIYGFGETWNKHLAQRGRALEIWDEAGTPDQCAWMPYFVSTNNYVFFNYPV